MTDLKLLLVDDNFQDVILFRSVLKKVEAGLPFNIICDAVDSGHKACRMIAASHYDLVFLDQQMPDPDGLASFEQIRQIPWSSEHPRPVMIAYSNCDLREFKARCLQMGMDEFIAKYVTEQVLLALIEKHSAARLKLHVFPGD